MRKYNFTILEEPQGKGRPRFTRRGHAYTPDKTRDYERFVAMQYHGAKFEGALRVTIVAHFKKPMRKVGGYPTKRPDADNIAKAILDALNGIAWKDDNQVVQLVVIKLWTTEHPKTDVSIERIDNEE